MQEVGAVALMKGGQRGKQQVVCTSATFCSPDQECPGGMGKEEEKQEGVVSGGKMPQARGSLNKPAFILKLNSRHILVLLT